MEWRTIPGYSNYVANSHGEVKTMKIKVKTGQPRNLLLSPRNINGYMAFSLVADNDNKTTVYVHQVVANTFLNKPVNARGRKWIITHKDGDKSNNAVNNLQWMRFDKFMQRQFKTGRRSNKGLWKKRVAKYGPMGGLKPPGRKVDFTPEEIELMKSLRKEGVTLAKLAERFKCSSSHIYNITNRLGKYAN